MMVVWKMRATEKLPRSLSSILAHETFSEKVKFDFTIPKHHAQNICHAPRLQNTNPDILRISFKVMVHSSYIAIDMTTPR